MGRWRRSKKASLPRIYTDRRGSTTGSNTHTLALSTNVSEKNLTTEGTEGHGVEQAVLFLPLLHRVGQPVQIVRTPVLYVDHNAFGEFVGV